jgi:hypothetical protein
MRLWWQEERRAGSVDGQTQGLPEHLNSPRHELASACGELFDACVRNRFAGGAYFRR